MHSTFIAEKNIQDNTHDPVRAIPGGLHDIFFIVKCFQNCYLIVIIKQLYAINRCHFLNLNQCLLSSVFFSQVRAVNSAERWIVGAVVVSTVYNNIHSMYCGLLSLTVVNSSHVTAALVHLLDRRVSNMCAEHLVVIDSAIDY